MITPMIRTPQLVFSAHAGNADGGNANDQKRDRHGDDDLQQGEACGAGMTNTTLRIQRGLQGLGDGLAVRHSRLLLLIPAADVVRVVSDAIRSC